MKERKATISEDGGSIEVYDKGKRYIIALGFSVWEWIRLVKVGKNLPGKKMVEEETQASVEG